MWIVLFILIFVLWKLFRYTGKPQPVTGAVFVTGCDSGMGETTAFHLSNVGYHVFAGCYFKESFDKYKDQANITPVQIDVANEESVNNCASLVGKLISEKKLTGLFGVLQCAGIVYTAPFEYIPISSFKRQIDVNFYGYVYVARAFLPLLKESTKSGLRRGRICFVSSGPLPGPGVPFITSYLAAKWGGEAVIQGLRLELKLRNIPIDCCMLSPGVVKPTRLAEEGNMLLEKTFNEMPKEAKDEYFEMVDVFAKFQHAEKGTHVSVVGQQMERIMRHGIPHLRYYVGYDSMASTVVGIIPTFLKELLIRNTLMGGYKKVPKFPFL